MSNNPKSGSRRKFIGNLAAMGAAGAIGPTGIAGTAGAGAAGMLGAGGLLSSCTSRREKYVPPVFPESAPDGPPLKAGLIGCGGRGTGAAFNFLDAGPNLEITALADLFQDRIDRCRNALREQRGVEIPDENCFLGFDGYQKVIDSGVDIILEASVSKFRPKHFEAAVQARKHVFLEKPGGVDPVGIRSIMASGRMAESAGLTVVAGTQRRHQLDYIHTFAQVQNGVIGDLISANCYWNRTAQPVTPRQEGWCDMEAMIRDRANWIWQTGDSIINLLVHNVDVVVWFFGKHPVRATGFGGRHRRRSGDMYDFFSVDFAFDDRRSMHGTTREIDGCSNKVEEIVFGTRGYTNCQNRIWDNNGNVIWEYQYPIGDDGQPTGRVAISPYDQEIINMITAIRTNQPINEANDLAVSSMVNLMGRESAYTGQDKTWEDMMNSNLELGPDSYEFGTYEGLDPEIPVPGSE